MKNFATMYRGMFYLPKVLERPEGYVIEKISTKAVLPIADVAIVDKAVVASSAKNAVSEPKKSNAKIKKEA